MNKHTKKLLLRMLLDRKFKKLIWIYAFEKQLHYLCEQEENDNCLPFWEKCKLEFWCQVKEICDEPDV